MFLIEIIDSSEEFVEIKIFLCRQNLKLLSEVRVNLELQPDVRGGDLGSL